MHPKASPNAPASGGGYMPYFYESGLFLSDNEPPATAASRPAYPAYSRYDFSSEPDPLKPFQHAQTVEQIISHGYFAIPGGEPETALISDKQHTSRLGLEDVIHQVRRRYELYQANMDELDQSVCEANNAVFRQVAAQGAPADNRQQYSASKMIQQVYEQKRAERADLWRDVSKLKLLLPESAQQYLASYRKMSILEDTKGDAP